MTRARKSANHIAGDSCRVWHSTVSSLVLTELPLGTMGGVEDGNACSGFHASGCAVGGRPKESTGADEVEAPAVVATAEGAARLRGCSDIVCAHTEGK